MKLTPLLLSILLLVSNKLKPLQPGYQKITATLIAVNQPIYNLKNKLNQQKLFIASLPGLNYQNLSLRSENSRLKTQNLLLKNQLDLNVKIQPCKLDPCWEAVTIKIIKTGRVITATGNQLEQISAGMPYIQDSNLVGIVQKISPPIIYILPLTHKDVSLQVQTISGVHGNYVYQDHTPQMINLADQTIPPKNEAVFTLPTEQIPEGLNIGSTNRMLTKPSNPSQKMEIKLLPLTLNPIGQIITRPY